MLRRTGPASILRPPPGPPTPAPAPAAEPDTETRILDLYRGGFGVALVLGAALLFLTQIDALGAARDAAFTAIVAIFALALILAPFIWRLGRNLADERSERIRSQERAEMAAHLHDSVLQTLTLMQKRADDPREVAALARRQERELRGWLAGRRERGAGGFAAALRSAAEEVEDAYLVKIEVVTVGDGPARRSGVTRSSAPPGRHSPTRPSSRPTAGRSPSTRRSGGVGIEAFVRDRGPGFDPAAAPADRRGVSESIVGRMQRHGGTATIAAVPGAGTEIASCGSREPGGELAADDRHRRRPRPVPERRPLRARGPVEVLGRGGIVEEAVGVIRRRSPTSSCSTCTCPAAEGWR